MSKVTLGMSNTASPGMNAGPMFCPVLTASLQVLPPLKYVIGRNKPLNFLVRNKWRNHEAIARSFIRETPTLLLSSLQASIKVIHEMPSVQCLTYMSSIN